MQPCKRQGRSVSTWSNQAKSWLSFKPRFISYSKSLIGTRRSFLVWMRSWKKGSKERFWALAELNLLVAEKIPSLLGRIQDVAQNMWEKGQRLNNDLDDAERREANARCEQKGKHNCCHWSWCGGTRCRSVFPCPFMSTYPCIHYPPGTRRDWRGCGNRDCCGLSWWQDEKANTRTDSKHQGPDLQIGGTQAKVPKSPRAGDRLAAVRSAEAASASFQQVVEQNPQQNSSIFL